MKQLIVMEKYPVYTVKLDKSETSCQNVDDVLAHLKKEVEAHPIAVYIGMFDHYAHTASLEVGQIAEDIKDAKNLICCFGKALPSAEVLAVRPRSIGVADVGDGFVISFLEAPNPEANDAMEKWVKGVADL